MVAAAHMIFQERPPDNLIDVYAADPKARGNLSFGTSKRIPDDEDDQDREQN